MVLEIKKQDCKSCRPVLKINQIQETQEIYKKSTIKHKGDTRKTQERHKEDTRKPQETHQKPARKTQENHYETQNKFPKKDKDKNNANLTVSQTATT